MFHRHASRIAERTKYCTEYDVATASRIDLPSTMSKVKMAINSNRLENISTCKSFLLRFVWLSILCTQLCKVAGPQSSTKCVRQNLHVRLISDRNFVGGDSTIMVRWFIENCVINLLQWVIGTIKLIDCRHALHFCFTENAAVVSVFRLLQQINVAA